MADEYQLLHKTSEVGEEIKYPSHWNNFIHAYMNERLNAGEYGPLTSKVRIDMIPEGKRRFEQVGEGIMTLESGHFLLDANINGERQNLSISTACFASLPYKPGAYIELQHADTIYRCYPEDGKTVIKFIDMVKILYEEHCRICSEKREHCVCKECFSEGINTEAHA